MRDRILVPSLVRSRVASHRRSRVALVVLLLVLCTGCETYRSVNGSPSRTWAAIDEPGLVGNPQNYIWFGYGAPYPYYGTPFSRPFFYSPFFSSPYLGPYWAPYSRYYEYGFSPRRRPPIHRYRYRR